MGIKKYVTVARCVNVPAIMIFYNMNNYIVRSYRFTTRNATMRTIKAKIIVME